MLVFWNKKLVFLSVPKTGTTALEEALASHADMVISHPPELKHAPLYRYNRFFRPMFERACKTDDMETMAVMREPVSWLASWYRYRRRADLRGLPNSTENVSFEEFVQEYMKGEQKAPFANVGSQAKFLEPRKNGLKVDHLFRYEDQTKLLGFLEDRLAMKVEPARRNTSPDVPLSLSPDTRSKLLRKCAEEFELYESLS
ncbi:MAG: sulfotransferase family protein [Shimia sp.]|nr:sulfotransferase family protein [Shimia sp.]